MRKNTPLKKKRKVKCVNCKKYFSKKDMLDTKYLPLAGFGGALFRDIDGKSKYVCKECNNKFGRVEYYEGVYLE